MKDILFKVLMLKGDAGNPTDEQTLAGVTEYMQMHPEAAIDETIINSAVDDWLDDHPEATTTVQDGSLTEAKFSDALKLKAIKDYVTPEMFGAKGDGVTDDTEAIQNAINSNKPVIFPIGTYLINSKIIIPDTCPYIYNFGEIVYSGNDYAFELKACVNKDYFFGVISASNGGCIKMDSANGFIQYVNISFISFSALTNCVYMRVPSLWINEIRFFKGRFDSGTNGVFIEVVSNGQVNHYVFNDCGFEGVTTGVRVKGMVGRVSCYGCRMEEATTNLVVCDNESFNIYPSFYWYGAVLPAQFIQNAGLITIYCYGGFQSLDGEMIATCCTIIAGNIYGETNNKAYRDGASWSSSNYIKTITSQYLQKRGNFITLADVNADNECFVDIDSSTLRGVGTLPSYKIYFRFNVYDNKTLTFRLTDGTVLKSYSAGAGGIWNKTIEISYKSNYGYIIRDYVHSVVSV